MRLRDKFRAKIEPQLEPGETLEQVFLAQTGPKPYWLLLGLVSIVGFAIIFWFKYSVFAVTDRRILVFRSDLFWHVKDVAATFPRETKLGPLSGIWARMEVGGTRYWVNKRFHVDVRAADTALPASAVPAD